MVLRLVFVLLSLLLATPLKAQDEGKGSACPPILVRPIDPWKTGGPGSFVRYATSNRRGPESSVQKTLKARTASRVTIGYAARSSAVPDVESGAIEVLRDVSHALPAGAAKVAVRDRGFEDVTAAGRTLRCRVSALSATFPDAGRATLTVWWCDSVPGGIVRAEGDHDHGTDRHTFSARLTSVAEKVTIGHRPFVCSLLEIDGTTRSRATRPPAPGRAFVERMWLCDRLPGTVARITFRCDGPEGGVESELTVRGYGIVEE